MFHDENMRPTTPLPQQLVASKRNREALFGIMSPVMVDERACPIARFIFPSAGVFAVGGKTSSARAPNKHHERERNSSCGRNELPPFYTSSVQDSTSRVRNHPPSRDLQHLPFDVQQSGDAHILRTRILQIMHLAVSFVQEPLSSMSS